MSRVVRVGHVARGKGRTVTFSLAVSSMPDVAVKAKLKTETEIKEVVVGVGSVGESRGRWGATTLDAFSASRQSPVCC